MQTLLTGHKPLFVLATMLLLTLPGCGTTMATVATNQTVCDVWKPVGWSKKDTDQTVTEVKVNNARREGWCHGPK